MTFGTKLQISTDTKAGRKGMAKALTFFGFFTIVKSAIGLYAVIKESRKAVEKLCLVLVLFIVVETLMASVKLYYLDNVSKGSKEQVVRIFNRGSEEMPRINKIQRSVSISYAHEL